jgi:hypothetical protein
MGMRHRRTPNALARFGKSGLAGMTISILVLCFGISTLLKGRLQYSNYWGGAVFAPFAILIGVLGIFAGIVTWRNQHR